MPVQKKERIGAPARWPRVYERIVRPLRKYSGNRQVWIGAILSAVILLTFAVSLLSMVEVLKLRDRIRSIDNTIAALSERTVKLQPGWADSSFPDVQPLGLGFSLVDLKAEPADAGVRVSGSIINGSSLDHSNAVFTIILAENRQAEFTIPTLKAGHSAPFEVVVGPATERSVPKKIRVLFSGSTVSYY